MQNIQIEILDHNLNGMPLFLAKMTQRGHQISKMSDLMALRAECIHKTPSKTLITLPHTTIKRMNHMTVAIVGLSTKCVSQLRTHAKRLTFLSTSTQYSSFESRADNYTVPTTLNIKDVAESLQYEAALEKAYEKVQAIYTDLIQQKIDKDIAGYILPQGLRKALIIHGDMDAWQYVIQLRLCRRNSLETQYVMRLLIRELYKIAPVWTEGMLPSCITGKCNEGKFCCKNKLTDKEVLGYHG